MSLSVKFKAYWLTSSLLVKYQLKSATDFRNKLKSPWLYNQLNFLYQIVQQEKQWVVYKMSLLVTFLFFTINSIQTHSILTIFGMATKTGRQLMWSMEHAGRIGFIAMTSPIL